MKKEISCITHLLLVGLFLQQTAPAEVFQFDSAGELSSFTINGDVQFVAGSGVSGSGALQPEQIMGVTPDVSALVWNGTTFSFDDANDKVRMSLMFQLDLSDDSTIESNTIMTVASLRLYDEPIPSTTMQDPVVSVDFYMSRVGNEPVKRTIGVRSSSNRSGGGRTFPIATPLADDHWFRLSGIFILAPSGDHNLFEYRLDDFGPTGSGYIEQVIAGFVDGSQSSNMKVFSESNVYAGFMVSRHAKVGAAFADNFVVVPEPSVPGLVAMGLIISMFRRKRLIEEGRTDPGQS